MQKQATGIAAEQAKYPTVIHSFIHVLTVNTCSQSVS